MPYASTVAAGSSVSFPVTGEQYVTVTTSGNTEGALQFTPLGGGQNSPINTQTLHNLGPAALSAKQYGPWGLPGTVTVSCKTGSASSITLGMGGSVSPFVLLQSSVPLIILSGDGGVNGASFGASGAITLSAAILTGLGAGLAGIPCFFYLPANAAGGTNPAGWFYGQWATDTTLTVYNNQYTSGDPSAAIPTTPTAWSYGGTGRMTQTTGAVTGITGITLPAGALGNNGSLDWQCKTIGDTSASNKIFRLKLGSTIALAFSATTQPSQENLMTLRNAGIQTKQIVSGVNTGIGKTNNIWAGDSASVDMTMAQAVSEEFQIGANTASLVRMALAVTIKPVA